MDEITVRQLILILRQLNDELQEYTVWTESDPSSPSTGVSWIDREGKRVFL